MANIKRELMVKNIGRDPYKDLIMVDVVQRLGIDYEFKEEIEQVLERRYTAIDELVNSKDLYFVSLCFRLLRQHHYNVSAGYF